MGRCFGGVLEYRGEAGGNGQDRHVAQRVASFIQEPRQVFPELRVFIEHVKD